MPKSSRISRSVWSTRSSVYCRLPGAAEILILQVGQDIIGGAVLYGQAPTDGNIGNGQAQVGFAQAGLTHQHQVGRLPQRYPLGVAMAASAILSAFARGEMPLSSAVSG